MVDSQVTSTVVDPSQDEPAGPSLTVTFDRFPEDATLGPDGEPGEAEVEVATVRRLYEGMVEARAYDQEATHLVRQGLLAVYPSSRGQEAAQVGSAAALTPHDWIFPSYREMGAIVQRGIPMEEVLHVWRGTWFAGHDPLAHRFGLLTVPLATQCLHAVGVGMTLVDDGEDAVVLSYLGDGATSEGDAHEAFNFAAVFGAPVVFLIQNNQYAISVPVHRQTRARSFARKALAYGMDGYRCDGNDVAATYAAVREAVASARAGRGPAIVEAVTYRMEPHTSSDDPRRYRSPDEEAVWADRDPLARTAATLTELGALDAEEVPALEASATRRARQFRETLVDVQEHDATDLFDHVYATTTPRLERQRAEVDRAQRR